MNCAQVKLVLVDLLYGELDDAESAAAREHLDACESCREEFARLQECRQQLSQVTEQPVRVDLARLCLRGARQWERSRRRWRRIGYAAAAAMLLIGIFVTRQVRCELQDGQMLIAWRHALPQIPARHVQPFHAPREDSPSEHLASAGYLRLRTRVLEQGLEAAGSEEPGSEGPTESPRNYRSLRDQFLHPTPGKES